jgi:hypothetical protein
LKKQNQLSIGDIIVKMLGVFKEDLTSRRSRTISA